MLAAEAELKSLMVAGLAGEKAAYRVLLTALGDVLRRYYSRRVGRDDAEDLVQDALIAIHTRRATYDQGQPFTPWLFAIARYKLLDFLRRKRVRVTVALDEADEIFAEDDSEAAMARRDLETLLSTLPEPTQALIRQVKIEGHSMQEAADKAGRSEVAVRVGIHRGLKTLSDRLRGKELP
ncbi:MAG TPA: sigma-70 family RNA polymerase sigma factor [Rhizomicrobium sp.]|nr:sigma-70 family RNA polymerase sigma factor [Rhizomicrobium sp.]